ncbi:MAG TPA: hypothetical protein VN733_03770 [Solirubrobacterales bacterium]|nr:hypothetical protein [Solirubrobacterales bacterium]
METDPERDPIAEEEAAAAAAEAARIGGPTPDDHVDDPAQRPVAEGGEGEAEGFELAEEELIDNAEHGDQKRFPDSDAPPPEEQSDATYGEPDQEIDQDE